MESVFSNLRSLFLGDDSETTISESQTIIHNLQELKNNFIPHPTYNPNYVPTRDELLNTETLNSLTQAGGNMIKGLRYENKLSEISSSSLPSLSEMYGGKRNKPSPGDLLHQQAVDYLKNDLKLSPLEARAYKALAYRHIKEKNSDSTSAERAKLMLSLVKSENFLDEFKEKLDETMKIIENIDSEKEKEKQESKEPKGAEEKSKKVKKSKE